MKLLAARWCEGVRARDGVRVCQSPSRSFSEWPTIWELIQFSLRCVVLPTVSLGLWVKQTICVRSKAARSCRDAGGVEEEG